MSTNQSRVHASVGQFAFADDYSNPGVTITTERETDEHDLLSSEYGFDGEFVMGARTRKPKSIRITGIARDVNMSLIDQVGRNGPVYVRTERWTGTAAVTKITTSYRREKDKYGHWLHDVEFTLLEIAEDRIVGNPEGLGVPVDNVGDVDVGTILNNNEAGGF